MDLEPVAALVVPDEGESLGALLEHLALGIYLVSGPVSRRDGGVAEHRGLQMVDSDALGVPVAVVPFVRFDRVLKRRGRGLLGHQTVIAEEGAVIVFKAH